MSAHAIEAKKHAMRQTQEGSWLLTISLAQEDTPLWLFTAPVGQRMALAELTILADETSPRSAPSHVDKGHRTDALATGHPNVHPAGDPAVPVGAGGLPTKEKRKWSSMRWVERFGIRCTESDFQGWVIEFVCGQNGWDQELVTIDEGTAAMAVRRFVGCRRRDIDGNPEAEQRAAVLLAEFDAYRGRVGRPG